MVLLALAAGIATGARADEAGYPNRPIHIIVPWPAGGVSDSGTRRIAALMEKNLGARIIVENRPGASGQVATEFVARSAPDGYTLLSGDIATHGINACIFPNLRVDPVKDFQPISLRGRGSLVLVVNGASPVRSVDDLVKLSQAGSEAMPYASPGLGTLQHLEMERFARSTGAKLRAVPYKGESPALIDVVGGQLPVMFAFPLVALPQIQDGRLRALAVTSRTRVQVLPETPTFREIGRPELEAYSWGAFFAPKGTPRPVVDRLARAVAKATEDPSLRQFLATFGSEPVHSTPEELGAWVASEIARLCAISKQAGIQME
jgi:tripartite-type tricarboxylate transporter receptor subunit TctC